MPRARVNALEQFAVERDTSLASWVVDHCDGPLFTLHRLVPQVFEHYVCIRHNGWRWPDDGNTEAFRVLDDDEKRRRIRPVRWSQLADETGVEAASVARWSELAPNYDYGTPTPGSILPPFEGELPLVVLDAIARNLLRHSRPDQQCICAVWEGFGGPEIEAVAAAGAARISGIGQQSHYLLRAPLEVVLEQWRKVIIMMPESSGLVPQLLWPISGEWLFHVPFEMHSSFLGCNEAMASDLYSTDETDAYPALRNVRLL